MFAANKKFHEIVIETQQEPDAVLALWHRFRAGFDYESAGARVTEEERAQRQHDEQMRDLDVELRRRRRAK